MALATAGAGLTAAAVPASAATVYELEGQWANGTPETVQTGDSVSATWWFNLNDDAAAPGNEPVDDVVVSVTLVGAVFDEIPTPCLTEEVDPASSVSDDGSTLSCNVGTQRQGSAVTLTTAARITALSGDQVTASATIADQAASLPPLEVQNPFVQDIRWEANTGERVLDETTRDLRFNWTVFHGTDGPAGPDSVSYDLDVTNSVGAPTVSLADACTPFSESSASGHPWSGGSHDESQMAPFVDDCTLTRLSSTTYRLTLSGIDYSKSLVPTESSTGAALPTDRQAVASGSIWIRVRSSANSGQVSLTSSAPTYVAVDGSTSTDDTDNNQSASVWSLGVHYGGWLGNSWSDTLRVARGATAEARTSLSISNVPDKGTAAGSCTIIDSRYASLESASTFDDNNNNAELPLTVEYYTGSAALLDPDSGSYDPNLWEGCGANGGWSATPPEDLGSVRAVRTVYNPSTDVPPTSRVFLGARVRIDEDVEVGQDVWMWSAYLSPNAGSSNQWIYTSRSNNPSDISLVGTATPGTRYPFTGQHRDILRVLGLTPDVSKSVTPVVVDPGGTATYSLVYSADGLGAVEPEVDGYTIVDTLPVGGSYVVGSATPEPETATLSSGQQELTWTLDDVATNAQHELSYDVDFAEDVEGGSSLDNSVTASFGGTTSSPAIARVTVNDAGTTSVIKTADQAFIPNLAGDGVGDGSWTVQVISRDPLPQSFTDTIDILPYVGDGRGTAYTGSYELSGVDAVPGSTVYYTTDDPSGLSDDPADTSNGASGDPSGNTVGWSDTYTPDATAVRVITGELAPFATNPFTVSVRTDGAEGGDVLVNRAQGRAENTRLVTRTSASTAIANYYSASLKKYVQDSDGEWRDANEVEDYPLFRIGDTVPYRIVVENTGQGTLTDLVVSDDQQPELGSFTIASLEPGESESHDFEIVLTEPAADSIVNTACADAAVPEDSQVEPTINCDPAGIVVTGEPTHTKELVSAEPTGEGRWELVYQIVVENTQSPSTTYSLVDELHFTDQATIVSADVTSAPDGVTLFEPAWDGQAETRVATNVALPGNGDEGYAPHVYEVTVVAEVPLQLSGAPSGEDDATACPAEGSDAAQGFNNTSAMSGPEGEIEEDQACAPIPSIDIAKSVSAGPTANGDGTWTVTYDVVATNTGAAEGTYGVTDRLSADGDLAVVSGEVVSAPEGVEPNGGWTGLGAEGAGANVIASDVVLPSGGTHTYQVDVVLGLAEGIEGAPVITDCAAPGAGGPGGLSNAAGIEHNDLTDEASTCVTVAAIAVDKTINSGPIPNGDGTWTIVYDIVAENIGAAAGDYDLRDRLHYGEGIEILDAAVVTVPEGAQTNAGWTGRGEELTDPENLVSEGVELAAGESHVYQVEVTTQMDEATIDPAQLECPSPGTGENGGLANSTSLGHNGIVAESEACASLPLIGVEKSISDGPAPNGDGTWTLTYDLVASNTGQAAGEYDLTDELQYGEGIVVEAATVAAAPEGVDLDEGWTGQGPVGSAENVIATGVTLAGDTSHTYQVLVTVSLDQAVVTPETLQCAEPGSGESGGLANSTELTHNGESMVDEACVSLPLIDFTKSLSGAVTPVDGEGGVYDVAYELTVTNHGPGAGAYDLDDTLAPGDGVEIVGIQDVTTDAPEPVGIEDGFDGLGAPRIVTDQSIAGSDGAPVVHTYTVIVRYAANLSDVVIPDADTCTTGDEGTVAGGLANSATVGWNGLQVEDDECVRPGKPTLDKALVSADPVGEGRWEVVYDLTVGNVGSEATTYDLDDELLFAPAVTVDSVAVAGPEGVTLDESFDGDTDQRVATGVSIGGLDDDGYAPHLYRVTVIAGVPLHFGEDVAAEDGTGSPACTVPAGGNLTEQGLNNAATLTDETGGTQTDTDCAPLPSIDITKSVVGDPVQGADDSWTVTYEITASNDGAAEGVYTLVDRLRFGAGIEVRSATVTSAPEGVKASGMWTGQGVDGEATNVVAPDVVLSAAGTHVYRVQVVSTVDGSETDSFTFSCPEPGSGSSGGFTNIAGISHNDLTDAAMACASPAEPGDPDEPSTPGGGLAATGAAIGWIAGGAAVLLLLGVIALAVVRSRRTAG